MNRIFSILFALTLLTTSCKSESKNATPKNFQVSYDLGKIVYEDLCINCHLDNGKGVLKAFPPLAGSDFLKNNQAESIKGVKFGMQEDITVNGVIYKGNMANQGLSDQEVADVMNYINNTWGNDYGTFITAKDVSNINK